ncbi:hypothetical protein AABB02_33640 [Streptomyces rimosus]|uniref:hypothetical protein n=1 Tax=Streptomyces rimosus TaxID=1927 RepID=UPI0031D054EE
MPDDTPPAAFDLDTAHETINTAILALIRAALRSPWEPYNLREGRHLTTSIREALAAGSAACVEVTRLRTELTGLRDAHRPQPHAAPGTPGALCAACSLHGTLVSWPCEVWSTAERLLTRGAP